MRHRGTIVFGLLVMVFCTVTADPIPITFENVYLTQDTMTYNGTTIVSEEYLRYDPVGVARADRNDVQFTFAIVLADKNVAENVPVVAIIPHFLLPPNSPVDTTKYALVPPTDALSISIRPKYLDYFCGIPSKEKVYDGTDKCSFVRGGESYYRPENGLYLTDDVHFTADVRYDNKNVGENKTITIYNSFMGKDKGNYVLPCPPTETFTGGVITPKQASVASDAVVEHSRPYDGTTDVRVLTPVALQGICEGDDVRVETVAAFADAEEGEDKTINVTHTLVGADKDNYVIDLSVLVTQYTDGVITLFHPVEGELTPDKDSYCQGDVALLSGPLSGDPVAYSFDAGATWQDYSPEVPLAYTIPQDAPAGDRVLEILFRNSHNQETTLSCTISIGASTDNIIVLFDDVLCVKNLNKSFDGHTIQWYHDGVLIEGATELFYREEGGLTGNYYYVLDAGTSSEMRCCNFVVSEHHTPPPFVSPEEPLVLTPNPASDLLTLTGTGSERVTIYNALGEKVYSGVLVDGTLTINVSAFPQGIYSVHTHLSECKLIKR